MKNREKYKDEILENSKKSGEEARVSACEFINRIVLPTFGDGVSCFTLNCAWCKFLLGIWFDEEYIEPPKPKVDWSKIPIDTLVQVRDRDDEEWELKYFKGIDNEDPANRFMAWIDGATSKTAYGDYEKWTYCELVEDEDDDK